MARLSCGIECTRTMLFVFNIIFLFLGFTSLGLGIYVLVNGNFSAIIAAYNITQALGGNTMRWIGILLIVLGIVSACFAAFGCFGAQRKNRALLNLYSGALILIILMEFAAVVVILVYRDKLWQSYDTGFEDVFQKAYRQNQTEVTKVIEQLEREFKCCGVHRPFDYTLVGHRIPPSCYANQDISRTPFQTGCATAVAVWIWNELPIIAVVVGIILFIELFGFISSLVLAVAISHSTNIKLYFKR